MRRLTVFAATLALGAGGSLAASFSEDVAVKPQDPQVSALLRDLGEADLGLPTTTDVDSDVIEIAKKRGKGKGGKRGGAKRKNRGGFKKGNVKNLGRGKIGDLGGASANPKLGNVGEPGIPGAEVGKLGAEPGIPGAEPGIPGAEVGRPGDPGGLRGGEAEALHHRQAHQDNVNVNVNYDDDDDLDGALVGGVVGMGVGAAIANADDPEYYVDSGAVAAGSAGAETAVAAECVCPE